jgi:K+-sensing histidine kinase KdpD
MSPASRLKAGPPARRKRRRIVRRVANLAAHDFRGGLTVIRECASLMQDGLCGDPSDEQSQMLALIDDRVIELDQLVGNVLDLTRLSTGRLRLSRTHCRVAEIISPLLRSLDRTANLNGHSLKTEIAGELPEVYCDLEMIQRVLMTLGRYAIKSSAPPGHIVLWAADDKAGHRVRLGFTTGGNEIRTMKSPECARLFENAGSTHRRGTNRFRLALATARKLVERNRGTLVELADDVQRPALSFDIPCANPAKDGPER